MISPPRHKKMRNSPQRKSARKSPRKSVRKSPRKSVHRQTSVGRGGRTRGWRAAAPRIPSERKALMKKCGSQCFLMPSAMKFPICAKSSCKPDCRGLYSAKVRAAQWKYTTVYKRASALINKLCK